MDYKKLTYGEIRAINELDSIFLSQWKNGFLPHIRYVPGEFNYSPDSDEWGVNDNKLKCSYFKSSGITQPANIVTAFELLYKKSEQKEILISYFIEKYENFNSYLQNILNTRNVKGDSLLSIIHPWESGTDNAPKYDIALKNARKWLNEEKYEQAIKKRHDIDKVIAEFRPGEKDYEVYGKLISVFKQEDYNFYKIIRKTPFLVQDVFFNTIFLKAIQSFIYLLDEVILYLRKKEKYTSFQEKEKTIYQRIFTNMQEAMNNKLFCSKEGVYHSYDLKDQEVIKINNFQIISPIYAEILEEQHIDKIINLIKCPLNFNPQKGFSFPSVSISGNSFNPINYWRGPIWPVVNWFIINGLLKYDKEHAKKITRDTLHLISEGFDLEQTRINAEYLMEFNSYGKLFTTPSRNQYKHGWLWDSGFAMIGWRNIKNPTDLEDNPYKRIFRKKQELLKNNTPLKSIREILKKEFQKPIFDEYYCAIDYQEYKAGTPLGSEFMTWTAAVFIDLYDNFEY